MRGLWVLPIVLLAAQPMAAGHLVSDDGLIVPGSRIGPIPLGMDRSALDTLNRTAACPVTAQYDETGQAVLLVTEWGGGCQVSPAIQVGVGARAILSDFGRPERVWLDATYDHADALWLVYRDAGIAFRVIVGRDLSTLIQAIAVFPAGTPTFSERSPDIRAPVRL